MQKRPDAIMLFAAGFGTRMGALTATRPKPLINVAGKALIDHALDIVQRADIGTVVANSHYLPEMLTKHLENTTVTLSHEPEILETGGGLRKALPLLGSNPVYTLNTDAIWAGENPLGTLSAAWDPAKMDALLLLVPPQNALGYTRDGDFILTKEGTIKRGAGLVYSGAQIIKTDGFKNISDSTFSLHALWDQMYDKNRIFGVTYSGGWCDVGTPAGIEIAEDMLEQHNV